MSDLTAVWQAHRVADDLSNSLASFYEEGSPAGQTELTDAQRQTLTLQLGKLRRVLADLGVEAAL